MKAMFTAASVVCANSSGNIAFIDDAPGGVAYQWSVSGGSITSGNGTSRISYNAGNSGSLRLGGAGRESSGGSATTSQTVAIDPPMTLDGGGGGACASSLPVTIGTQAHGGNGQYTYFWQEAH